MEELLARIGSVTPDGGATVAVLSIVPVEAMTVAVTTKVAVPPTGRSTVVETSPVPEGAPQQVRPSQMTRRRSGC